MLFVGRARLRFPLEPGLERRFEALSGELDWRQLGTALDGRPPPDRRFALARPFPLRRLDGPLWYLRLPWRVARELRRFDPDAVIAQGAQETALTLLARRLARSQAKVVLDLHGDWKAPTRLYGSRARRLLDPFSDALARRALRRADGVRTISEYTTELVRAAGIEPAAEFPAFMDLSPFTSEPVAPLPEAPRALFVGVLERYKAFDVLADAWRQVAAELPDADAARRRAGNARAARARRSSREYPVRVEWSPRLSAEEVSVRARRGDAARPALSLGGNGPRRDRGGLPRACRHRESRRRDPGRRRRRRDGRLVPPGDADALADELVRVLGDRALAERLGAEGRRRVEPWLATPDEYARRVRALVDGVVAADLTLRRP